MAGKFIPKIISANDLLSGDVIYLTDEFSWTKQLDDAVIASTESTAVELLSIAGRNDQVVGPYVADVALRDARPVLLHIREQCREQGPSVRPDLASREDVD